MPKTFDLQRYQANYDPISGGPFVSVQDVLNGVSQMWGEVLTEMVKIIPTSAEQLIPIIIQGMPQLISAILPTDGSTSPLITGFMDALSGDLVGEVGNQLPQWESLLIQLGPQLGTALVQQGMALAGFAGGTGILEQLISAGGGTGTALTDFTSLFGGLGPLSELFTGLGSGTPLLSQLISAGGGSGNTLADFGNLFGGAVAAVEQFIPDFIPLTSLVNEGLNLLTNGAFESAGSVDTGAGWDWTNLFSMGDSLGSAVATHDGTVMQLFSKPMTKVTAGQNLSVSQGLKWTGLAGVLGSAFELGLQFYDAAKAELGPIAMLDNIIDPVNDSSTATGADANGFVPLSGTSVVPAGASFVRQVLSVNSVPTGTSYWSNSSLQKLSLPDIFSFLDPASGLFDASALTNIANIPLLAMNSVSGLLSGSTITGALIPLLDASKVATGVFGLGLIPNLPASQLTSGTLLSSLIPSLDGSKIGSGTVASSFLPSTAWFASIPSSLLSGVLGAGLIPSLDGSKIGSGTIASGFLPPTAWFSSIPSTLLSGTIASGLIPSLDASKITTGVISETVTTIGTLRDSFLNGLFGGASGSGYTNTQAQQQAAIVAQQASAAAASAAAAQDQLAAQQQAATSASGTNFHTSFGGADGAALTTDWSPNNTNILTRGSQGYMGLAAGLADGTYATSCVNPATTSDQRVTVVLGDQGGSTSAVTTVVWHCPSGANNNGACLIIANDSVKFGFLSATNVFTQIGATYTATISQGNKIDCYNVGNVFTVNVNGAPRITATDAGNLITLTNHYSAVQMQRTTAYGWFGFNTVYDSYRLSSFGIADYSTTAGGSTTAGWKINRASTTAVTLSVANGASALFPASFFAATDYASGVTVTTLGTGVITITTAGWYEVNCSVVANSKTVTGLTVQKLAFPWALAINGAQASGTISAGGSITVYLNAGDTVQPMASACGPPLTSTAGQTASNQAAGVALGCDSLLGFAHFSGKLVDV
jgi:hypothetical protein